MVLDRYAYLICVLWQEGGTIRKTGEGNCGIMNAKNETGVAARKRSLNHDFQFYFQRKRHGIMNAKNETGVAARKRSLNHDFRFYFQRNHHGIMNAKEFTNDTEKIIKYLFASAAQC